MRYGRCAARAPGERAPRSPHRLPVLPAPPLGRPCPQHRLQVTLFPAANPSGREQIGYLRDCLNKTLNAEKAQAIAAGVLSAEQPANPVSILENSPDAYAAFRSLRSIYASGMAELARQVSCNCTERGQLLVNLWASAQKLNERYTEMKARARREHDAARTTCTTCSTHHLLHARAWVSMQRNTLVDAFSHARGLVLLNR